MASVYDRRMEEIAADRAARRQDGQGRSEEIYRDAEAPGSGWVTMCSWLMILAGLPMLALFPPLGIVMLVAGPMLLLGNKTVVAPTESAMYRDVAGRGATPATVGRLIWTGFVGFVIVIGAFGFGLLVLMFL